MRSKLIVALDFPDQTQALSLVDKIDPQSCALKVGHEMFTHYGASFVKQLINKQFKVFLDLKLYDIPNTVAQACKVLADLGVWMINVHASGGLAMMEAARSALSEYKSERPLLIAVTVLTSFSNEDLIELGIKAPLLEQVALLASLAQEAGLDGVVCSAQEVPTIKQLCGSSFLTVTPGIRLAHDAKNDQVRTMTPEDAVQNGSDYLVIGRPITKADDPFFVIKQINDRIGDM